MKKHKKIIIGLAGILLLASLILIIVFAPKKDDPKQKLSPLESKLKDIAIDYYENDFKKFKPNLLASIGTFMITLDSMQGAEKDISEFEKHNCDYEETYANLIYVDEEHYDVEVHLACDEEK